MTWTMFLIAVIVSVLGRVIGEDAKTLIPRFSTFLVRRAAQRINGSFNGGFYEEWLAHLEETPELSLKLWHAVSIYLWGAGKIGREVGYSDEALKRYDKFKRLVEFIYVCLSVPFVSVVVLASGTVSKVSGCKALVAKEFVGQNGRRIQVNRVGTLRELKSNETQRFFHTAEKWRVRHGSRLYIVPPVGRFLRKTSLDELPMLWSVFKGDLSLIGPRMLTESELENSGYDGYTDARPGITGVSQILAFASSDELDWAKLDREYCERRNFFLDLRILRMTITTAFWSNRIVECRAKKQLKK